MKDSLKTSKAAPGEAHITIAGTQHAIKFPLNVMRDWGTLTGRPATDFGVAIIENHLEAFSGLIACAVRRFVPEHADFTQEQAVDLIEEMGQAEANALAKVIIPAITKPNPLLLALAKQVATQHKALPAPADGEATGSTEPQAVGTH